MKLYIITLGFCNAKTLELGFQRLEETSTVPKESTRRIFLDQHYPLDRENNIKKITELCAKHNFEMYDSLMDRGLHKGFNYLTSMLPLEDDDLILLYDPDTYVDRRGFDSAMANVLNSDSEIQYVSSWHNPIEATHGNRVRGHFRKSSMEFDYFVPDIGPEWEMMSLSMHRWSFIKSIGGFKQPREYYGFLEQHFWDSVCAMGKRMAFVRGFDNENPFMDQISDPEYHVYKLAHSANQFKGSFAEWLEKK